MLMVFLTKTAAKREGGDKDMEKQRQSDIKRERHAQTQSKKLPPTVTANKICQGKDKDKDRNKDKDKYKETYKDKGKNYHLL